MGVRAFLGQAASYTANVFAAGFSAIKSVIPATIALTNPEPKKILRAVMHTTTHTIFPLIVLDTVNRQLQTYAHANYEEDNRLMPFIAVDWAVWAITQHIALSLLIETLVIDSQAATAFNAHKTNQLSSRCTEEKCNFKRRIKGNMSEILILFANDGLVLLISFIPYVGYPMHLAASVLGNGTLIVRSAMLDSCSRHRTTHSEKLVALGATYTGVERLVAHLFKVTVGMPPYLVHRTIQHFLLLAFVNTAAHMDLPSVEPAPLNPVGSFEKAMRVATDVLFAGVMDKTLKLLAPIPGKPPYIALPSLLKKMTDALNHNRQPRLPPTGSSRFFKKLVPPVFHSTEDVLTNPVVRIFWPDLQEFLMTIIETIKSSNSQLNLFPEKPLKLTLPKILFYQFGIPVKLTLFLITLSHENEFRVFVLAVEQWLQWHKIGDIRPLAAMSAEQLAFLSQGGLTKPLEEGERTVLIPTNIGKTVVLNPQDILHEQALRQTTELNPDNLWRPVAAKTKVAVGFDLFQRPTSKSSVGDGTLSAPDAGQLTPVASNRASFDLFQRPTLKRSGCEEPARHSP